MTKCVQFCMWVASANNVHILCGGKHRGAPQVSHRWGRAATPGRAPCPGRRAPPAGAAVTARCINEVIGQDQFGGDCL